MPSPAPAFRRPRPSEAAVITALALRSKRHWGYDDALTEALADELTFAPTDLADPAAHIEVLEAGDRLVGVFRLRRRTELAFFEESDPYAEPFYRHLGAVRVAMSPSSLIPGRSVPLMRYSL